MFRIRDPLAEITDAAFNELQFRKDLIERITAKASSGMNPPLFIFVTDLVHPPNPDPFTPFFFHIKSAMQWRIIPAPGTFRDQFG